MVPFFFARRNSPCFRRSFAYQNLIILLLTCVTNSITDIAGVDRGAEGRGRAEAAGGAACAVREGAGRVQQQGASGPL